MKIIDVEQGSTEWLKARIAMITGTRLSEVLGTPKARKTLIYELIAEELTNTFPDAYVSPSMERGNIEEPFAVREYEKRRGVKTHKIGFIKGENGYTGLSPDRLIKKGKVFIGGVEIKNPDSSTQIKYLVSKKIPPEYEDQVLHYFLIIPTLEYVDFASYDARIQVEPLKMHLVRVTREELSERIAFAEDQLVAFRSEWVKTLEELTF